MKSLCCNCPSRPRLAEPGCSCSCHGAEPAVERVAGKVYGATNYGTIVTVAVDLPDGTRRPVHFDRRMFENFARSVDGRLVGLPVEIELGEFNVVERVLVPAESIEEVRP